VTGDYISWDLVIPVVALALVAWIAYHLTRKR
jgi:hypothetical protein